MIRKIQSIHLYWFHACLNNLNLMFSEKHDKALFKFIVWVWRWTFSSKWLKPPCCSCISPTHSFLRCHDHASYCCIALIVFFLCLSVLSPLSRRCSDDEFDDTDEDSLLSSEVPGKQNPLVHSDTIPLSRSCSLLLH